MYDREKYNLEFKEEVTKTYLKTVSAFSNYNDGEIIFGINDMGNAVGIDKIDENCLRIENMINDSLDPMPSYTLEVKKIDGEDLIILNVKKGKYTPYYYKGKAYRRSATSTLEVERLELNRLVMEGVNIDYEEQRSLKKDLNFNLLESKLKDAVGIEKLDLDILRTLNLYNKEKYYNIAGELLSDENSVRSSGIDVVRFGKDINQILYRETIDHKSILFQYDKAIEIFELYYQYEEIEEYHRVKKELIPKEAYREAIANAIVHRVWDVRTHIQISMHEDRVEINSPGGLPRGISEEDYLNGNVSILRNPIIAGVFYRLNIIEKFGTGITRIISEYSHSVSKPKFKISENNIKMILPVIEVDESNLSDEEAIVYNILKANKEISRAALDKKSGFNKSKTLRVLNILIDKNIVEKMGSGRGITYKLN